MRVNIAGVPYAQLKSRGRVEAPREWSEAIRKQTAHLEPVSGPCRLMVVFRLPPSKFPSDHPYGMDLDNLLKRLLDALQETVFRAVPGRDGCVIELKARKERVGSDAEAGAELNIQSLSSNHLLSPTTSARR
jgi:Holliday junction resolvase RusA-like endonuclease